MESRLDRYLEEKKQKRKGLKKYLVFLLLIAFLFIAISIVDDSLYNYFNLSDTSVFNYEYKKSTHVIELFGNKYNINLSEIIYNIKNQIVDIFQ
ncbi:MAG: hypothetical protein ACTHVE_05080 [Senegalia sp. (in: firmicutes)]|uniref:hypothetical protein n=1 Tax=Senegalia sp. (in: firmicutes) TaxID=1924098 RepID=UPI003F9CCC06